MPPRLDFGGHGARIGTVQVDAVALVQLLAHLALAPRRLVGLRCRRPGGGVGLADPLSVGTLPPVGAVHLGHLGHRVDRVICEHFAGHTMVARALSSDDHPGRPVDNLVDAIITTGTDRYDPHRPGDRYTDIANKQIDLFGMRRKVISGMRLFANFELGLLSRLDRDSWPPDRLDIVTIYDSTRLRAVLHQYVGRPDRKRDGFRFVDPQHRSSAVLGVLKLDR